VPANAKDNKTSQTTNAGAASPDKAANLSQIMVTATKRAESIQSVPVTVTVVSAAQLQNQGLNNIADLTDAVPALSAQAGQPIALQIRGIGVPQNAQTAEPSVGIVVDGVSLGNAMASAPQLFDVARVEVLEGPQDTLFGRSTSAGVLNITTNAPDPSKAEVIVHADQGSRDSYTHQAVLNLPVSAYSALRLSVADTRQPDTVYNDYQHSWGENRNQSARLRYLWQPTDKLTVNLIADYSRIFEKGGFTDFPVYQSTPGSALSNLLSLCGLVPTQDNNRTCSDGPSGYTAKSEGLSGSGRL
jgi:iron complex outermembrane receptor protein